MSSASVGQSSKGQQTEAEGKWCPTKAAGPGVMSGGDEAADKGWSTGRRSWVAEGGQEPLQGLNKGGGCVLAPSSSPSLSCLFFLTLITVYKILFIVYLFIVCLSQLIYKLWRARTTCVLWAPPSPCLEQCRARVGTWHWING